MSTNNVVNRNIGPENEDFLAKLPPSASALLNEAKPYSDVPDELKALDNWVCFRHETKLNGETQNAPYCVDNIDGKRHAKSNDSSTWSTFDGAVQASINPARNLDGVSFMLLGTPYLGFDFDAVVQNQILDPFVASILRLMGDPYAELSYSDTGSRVFVECANLPKPQKTIFKEAGHGVEIYHGEWAAKALTIKGNRYSGHGVPTITPAQFELVHLLCSQFHDAKFKALWLGDTSAYGSDKNRADEALCCRLARLLNFNPDKIDAAFRMSGLMRTKWTQRKDYRDSTISKAIKFEKTRDVQPSKTGEPALETTRVKRMGNAIRPKKLRWLWQDKISMGKITLFAGHPDNGKSLAATNTAATCSTGRAFPNSQQNLVPPSGVLMLIGEDDLDDTTVPRLMAANADMSKIHLLEGVKRGGAEEDDVRLDRDLAAVEAELIENPDIRLVVIDPISNYLGDVSMVNEQDVRRVMIPLKNLAAKCNVAILIIMHLNKKSDLDAIARVGGAMAFIGVSRSAWIFQRDAETDGRQSSSFTMSGLKNNLTAARGGLSYTIDATKIPVPDEPEDVWGPFIVWGEVNHKTANEALGKPLPVRHGSANRTSSQRTRPVHRRPGQDRRSAATRSVGEGRTRTEVQAW
ncbi:MAG TPA: AAA family ATPase [Candidatus Acidoferrales bacterium]|jgi:hypothetical protein|nr:AAA family ATPase [Candidatus Acidoferrales bacterium]